jgi:preprotein translocase subunit SecA
LSHGANTVDELSVQTKQEITDKLANDDARTVVLAAANTARKAASDEMHKLSSEYPSLSAEPLYRWCHNDARPYILNVVDKNWREHDEFLKIIEELKK